jgi:hypothetical protein
VDKVAAINATVASMDLIRDTYCFAINDNYSCFSLEVVDNKEWNYLNGNQHCYRNTVIKATSFATVVDNITMENHFTEITK